MRANTSGTAHWSQLFTLETLQQSKEFHFCSGSRSLPKYNAASDAPTLDTMAAIADATSAAAAATAVDACIALLASLQL